MRASGRPKQTVTEKQKAKEKSQLHTFLFGRSLSLCGSHHYILIRPHTYTSPFGILQRNFIVIVEYWAQLEVIVCAFFGERETERERKKREQFSVCVRCSLIAAQSWVREVDTKSTVKLQYYSHFSSDNAHTQLYDTAFVYAAKVSSSNFKQTPKYKKQQTVEETRMNSKATRTEWFSMEYFRVYIHFSIFNINFMLTHQRKQSYVRNGEQSRSARCGNIHCDILSDFRYINHIRNIFCDAKRWNIRRNEGYTSMSPNWQQIKDA